MGGEAGSPGGNFAEVFREAVLSAMTETMGATGAHAMIYHLGPVDYDDAGAFHARLQSILGSGTPCVENIIVRRLAFRLGFPSTQLNPGDLVKSVALARRLQKSRTDGAK